MGKANSKDRMSELAEKKLLAEIELIQHQIEFQKTQDAAQKTQNVLNQLTIAEKRRPWWRREPIQSLTLAFTILSTFIGMRPQSHPPEIVIQNQPTFSEPVNGSRDGGSSGSGPQPQGKGSDFKFKYYKAKEETEQQRWAVLLERSPENVRVEIQRLLDDARTLYGDSADVEIIRQYVQSHLELAHRTDPVWPYLFWPKSNL
jgi:hypothetical protein